jgi:cyclic pyranopterin monophosphate synthase
MDSNQPLTHLDSKGQPHMVDVGAKEITQRRAVAKSRLQMRWETRQAIENQEIAKGNVISTAILAGIQAAKYTWQLIPLCHILPLDGVEFSHEWISNTELQFIVTVRSTGRTGVEMEALVAASTAALTVYDMCKSKDREMTITHVALWEKSGGKSGAFVRTE